MKIAFGLAAAIVSLFSQTEIVVAQQYPSRVVENSVWASAGGGTDSVNRLISKVMEKDLGQSIIVSNRTGGGGAVAMNYVWTKPHDGHFLLGASEAMQNAAVMGFHTTVTRDWRWYMVGGAPAVISVRPDSPHKNISDLVNEAQSRPGKVNITGCAIGCVFHLKSIGLADAAKTKFNYVPYGGSGPAMVALMSGDGDAVISSVSEQAEYLKGGKLRALAMVEMSPYELAGVGTIPAAGDKYQEVGNMPARQWLGFAVPADTPKHVTDKLDAAFKKAMEDEELKSAAARMNLKLVGAHGDESMKILSSMESAVSWKLQELGVAKISPDQLGIPKP